MKQSKEDIQQTLHDFTNDLNGILNGILCLKENFYVDQELSMKLIELLDEKRKIILKNFHTINAEVKRKSAL